MTPAGMLSLIANAPAALVRRTRKGPAHVSLSKANVSCAGEGEPLARPVPPLELPIRPP
jgi:hypothetical protein